MFFSDDEVRDDNMDGEKHLVAKEVIKGKGDEGLVKDRCGICSKKVVDLDKHILTTHKEDIQCQLCDQTVSVSNLRWHILKEHSHRKVPECSLCDKKFSTMNALKSHIKKTHLSTEECGLCDEKFLTKNALKSHIKKIHLSGETPTCTICNKEYKDLYHHIKFKHEQIRNYECSYCRKKFQSKKLLYNHVQSIHLGEKSNCLDCKKDFSVDNFQRHIKEFHEGIKKPCPKCGKEFGRANWSRHIRQVHNKESTKCPDCGKALSISNMNKHIQSVHNKLKQVCSLCNKEVPYSLISVHKRRNHNIGKSVDDVTPRGPNITIRKSTNEKFDKIKEDNFNHQRNNECLKEEGEYDFDKEGLEDLDHGVAEDSSGAVRVGEEFFFFTLV